jgi:lambda repressor-like predicted transcriptional regulator
VWVECNDCSMFVKLISGILENFFQKNRMGKPSRCAKTGPPRIVRKSLAVIQQGVANRGGDDLRTAGCRDGTEATSAICFLTPASERLIFSHIFSLLLRSSTDVELRGFPARCSTGRGRSGRARPLRLPPRLAGLVTEGGAMVSGRKPNLERRRRAAELRARGLTLAAIGREMHCTRQAVHHLLDCRPRQSCPRPRKTVACPGCRAALPLPRFAHALPPTLCMPCLARRPRASFAQRLRAHCLATGLSRAALAQKAGIALRTVAGLERGEHRPHSGTLEKLAQALGVEPGELLPGRRHTPRARPGPASARTPSE